MDPENQKKNHKMGHARLIDSFKYAGQGVGFAFANEQNFRIHLVIAVLAIVAGFIFGISLTEWVTLAILIGLVLAAELFNTSIEATIDLQTSEIHPLAKKAKDSASAAVLVLSIVAFVGGIIIFIPKFLSLVWR